MYAYKDLRTSFCTGAVRSKAVDSDSAITLKPCSQLRCCQLVLACRKEAAALTEEEFALPDFAEVGPYYKYIYQYVYIYIYIYISHECMHTKHMLVLASSELVTSRDVGQKVVVWVSR